MTDRTPSPSALPERFATWFENKGWSLRPHQQDILDLTTAGQSSLLIAPTGAGKTLAGFLPSLIDLAGQKNTAGQALHTLYISPLKALSVDVARNLQKPIDEMGLSVTAETRTGDTPPHKRQRQKQRSPHILLTTPEQLALMLTHQDSARYFASLKRIVLDELHALVTNKRGIMLALSLARLRQFSPEVTTTGLSATVADETGLRRWIMAQDGTQEAMAPLVKIRAGAAPQITILQSSQRLPWAGHSAHYALQDIYQAIKEHQTTLVFVNTRSQAERVFQGLWECNEDHLPIALHHGSLDKSQRRKVEAAMAAGRLQAIVCTSTLDLGIDWGDVDLVIHVGAPKGASRLAQRIGRSNHRLDEPSKALLVPANRFEVMECQVALDANYVGAQDSDPVRPGSLDVLAQHIMGMACAAPFDPDQLYRNVITAFPYRHLTRSVFDQVLDFVSHGGYALQAYDRYARLKKTENGLMRVAQPRLAQLHRLNVGTIVEAQAMKVRLARRMGKTLKPGRARSGRAGRRLSANASAGRYFSLCRADLTL
jgi:ATP-dependent Lhr-like helicase